MYERRLHSPSSGRVGWYSASNPRTKGVVSGSDSSSIYLGIVGTTPDLELVAEYEMGPEVSIEDSNDVPDTCDDEGVPSTCENEEPGPYIVPSIYEYMNDIGDFTLYEDKYGRD